MKGQQTNVSLNGLIMSCVLNLIGQRKKKTYLTNYMAQIIIQMI